MLHREKSVIIIQFLKGRERRELDFLEELDNFDFKFSVSKKWTPAIMT